MNTRDIIQVAAALAALTWGFIGFLAIFLGGSWGRMAGFILLLVVSAVIAIFAGPRFRIYDGDPPEDDEEE